MNSKTTTPRLIILAFTLVALAVTPVMADYDAGLSFFKKGDYVKSAAEWEAVVANAPEYSFGYAMLGNCYLKLKKYRDAEPQFRKAIELAPGKFDYHANLAKTMLSLKKYDEVIVVLDQAESLAKAAPHKLILAKMRGLSLNQVKDYARASSDLKKANPAKDHQVASGLVRACYSTDDYACLKKATRQALALKSTDERSLNLFVRFAVDAARRERNAAKKVSYYSDAAAQGAKLVQISKDKAKAHALYGAALLGTKKKHSQAIGQFLEVLKLEPKNCNAMLNIGTAQQELKKWDDLVSWSKKATQCNSKVELGWDQMALAYNKLHDWDNAIAAATKAVATKGSSAYAGKLLKTAKDGRDARKQRADVDADAERVKRELEEEERRAAEEAKRLADYAAGTGTGGTKKKKN